MFWGGILFQRSATTTGIRDEAAKSWDKEQIGMTMRKAEEDEKWRRIADEESSAFLIPTNDRSIQI